MRWDIPKFVTIKMDAEIGSYQEDDPSRGPFFAEQSGAVVKSEGKSAGSNAAGNE
jgi:hypothetical protein